MLKDTIWIQLVVLQGILVWFIASAPNKTLSDFTLVLCNLSKHGGRKYPFRVKSEVTIITLVHFAIYRMEQKIYYLYPGGSYEIS